MDNDMRLDAAGQLDRSNGRNQNWSLASYGTTAGLLSICNGLCRLQLAVHFMPLARMRVTKSVAFPAQISGWWSDLHSTS